MTCLKWKMSYIQKSREQVDRNSASLMCFFSVCFHLSVFFSSVLRTRHNTAGWFHRSGVNGVLIPLVLQCCGFFEISHRWQQIGRIWQERVWALNTKSSKVNNYQTEQNQSYDFLRSFPKKECKESCQLLWEKS